MVLLSVVPVFMVILLGYIVGRRMDFGAQAERLVNHYVLFVALPLLLFLPIARARPEDLANWPFTLATLLGIAGAYLLGGALASRWGIQRPQASLVSMACCYGTTGYMGVPILLAAFGERAAVPAAMATVLHNVPAIMAVIITHDACQQRMASRWHALRKAGKTVLSNPLVVAVLAGSCFSVMRIPVPVPLESFSRFLGAAAGPTALFALGVGLSRIRLDRKGIAEHAYQVVPVMLVKLLIQPVLTLGVLLVMGSRPTDIWFITALVMAAQPVGAGVYVFARQHGFFDGESSMVILLSLVVAVFTVSGLLHALGG